ncbi:hypothetical protein BGZ54_010137 [Gamsiella multidivaricata]|nr:hypothetical protein BGZ54_010137 [Gamsiella multidivaricata]
MSTHKLCMIPGPIEFHEDVLQAMATPSTSHVAPNFIPVLGESIELLRQILFTSGQPFIIAGSGTLGWDMTACNLIEAATSATSVTSTSPGGISFVVDLNSESERFSILISWVQICGELPFHEDWRHLGLQLDS